LSLGLDKLINSCAADTNMASDHRYLLQNDSPFATDNPQKRVVTIITLFFSCVALVCSMMILVLIRRLRVWNPQTSLVWWMSVCQCTYDASFFSFVAQASGSTTHWSYYTASFFQLFGGISVTLFTNVITAVLMWVIISRRNIDLFRYFHWVILLTMGPGLAIGIAYLANKTDDVYLGEVLSPAYYWTRLSSIFINVVFYVITQNRVNKITGSTVSRSYSVDGKSVPKKLSTHEAIATLTRRSKYYWIVQAVSRSGAAVYEGTYGYHGYTGFTNTNQYVGALFFAVLTPSASIGYLAIFLYMQPRAYDSFKSLFLVEIPDFIMCRTDKVLEAAIRESHVQRSSQGAARFQENRRSIGGPPGSSSPDASKIDSNTVGSAYTENMASNQSDDTLRKVDIPGRTSDIGSHGSVDNRPLPPVKSPVASPHQLQSPYPPPPLLSVASPANSVHSNSSVPGSWRAALHRTLGSDFVANAARFGHDPHVHNSTSTTSGMGLRRNFGSGNIQDLNDLEDDELFDIIQDNEADDAISALTELSKAGNPVHGRHEQSSMSSAGGGLSRSSGLTETSEEDPYDFEYCAPSFE